MRGPLPGQHCCLVGDPGKGGRDGEDVGCVKGAGGPDGTAGGGKA